MNLLKISTPLLHLREALTQLIITLILKVIPFIVKKVLYSTVSASQCAFMERRPQILQCQRFKVLLLKEGILDTTLIPVNSRLSREDHPS